MAATVMKVKKPLIDLEATISSKKVVEEVNDTLTVEKYLELQFEEMIKDFHKHTDMMISKLREEYKETEAHINSIGNQNIAGIPIVVTLKCISGPHTGQKFRLESSSGSDDEFKMGRSTGRLFKEKGVSLYKDKEISTTHSKIEFKNGSVFLIDCKSTNGTQLNEEDIEESIPYKLAEGDKITLGTTVLLVHLSALQDDE